MSFLKEVVSPQKSIISNAKKGGFLSNVTFQTPREKQLNQIKTENQGLEANANKGLLSNMLSSAKDIFMKPINAAKEASQATFENIFRTGGATIEAGQKGNIPLTVARSFETALSIAGVPLMPLTIASNVASKYPLLKPAADVLNTSLGVIELPFRIIAENFAKAIPESLVGKETKDELVKTIGDVAGFTGTFWIAGKVMETLGKGEKLTKEKINEIKTEAENLPPEAKKINVKNLTPNKTQINPRTPYIPESQLPTIQVGKTPKGELPVIQTEVKTKPPAGYTYEPIKPEAPITPAYQPKGKFLNSVKKAEIVEKPTLSAKLIPEIPVEGKPAKAALDINRQLAERGIEELPIDQLTQYKNITKPEIINKVSDALSHPDSNAMALGQKPLPVDVPPALFFKAKVKQALLENNFEFTWELSKSPLAREGSLLGQQLGEIGFIKADFLDPVSMAQDLKKSYETTASKSTKRTAPDVAKELRKSAESTNLEKADLMWDKF